MTCDTNQPWFVKKEIVTVTPPVYPQVDPDCDDEKNFRDWGRQCERKRKATTKGEYELRDSDHYWLYVDEQVARILYYGYLAPPEGEEEAEWDKT